MNQKSGYRGGMRRAAALAATVASCAVLWIWSRASSPAAVVDQAGQAIKSGDWKTVYHLVNWSADQRKLIDEGRFVSLAAVYSKVITLQDYQVGSPSVNGEGATVPVVVTAKVSSLISSSTKTNKTDVRCRLVGGHWLIEPDLGNGLLGLGSAGIGGL